jgi:FkbM family methyltransferase
MSKIGPSQAQLQQDFFVLQEVGVKRHGFFVEVGACDGLKFSNTALLEKDLGWKGILAEPAKVFWKALNQNRACTLDSRCVWSRSGETVDFIETTKPELSTMAEFLECDGMPRKETAHYPVETVSLNDLLLQHGAPKQIDYVSIDTEGSEYEILSSFDFDAHDVKVFTIEHNYTPKREEVYRLMTSKDYQRKHHVLYSRWDDWYSKRS